MSTHHPSTAGMTLIEVVVASSLLAVGLMAGIGAMGTAGMSSQRRQNADVALAEIQSQVEIFQAFDNPSLQSQFSSGDTLYFDIPELTPARDPVTGVLPTMAGKVQRIGSVNNGSVSLTSLRFSVTWQDAMGPRTVEQFFHYTQRR